MSFLFSKPLKPDEVVKKWKRELKREERELERAIRSKSSPLLHGSCPRETEMVHRYRDRRGESDEEHQGAHEERGQGVCQGTRKGVGPLSQGQGAYVRVEGAAEFSGDAIAAKSLYGRNPHTRDVYCR